MPRALLVDDDPRNLYLLTALLTGSGYECVSVANGAEALEAARREAFDLVISDILMPVMDGFSLCRAWKQDDKLREIPFIFYTATYTDPKDEQFALSLGADAFIVKPMDPCEFTHAVSEIVGKSRPSRSAVKEASPTPEEVFLREYNATLIRKLEDKIIQLNRRNEQLAVKDFAIASAISGIAIADPGWTFTYVNQAMCDLLGRPEAELLGSDARKLLEDGELLREALAVFEARGRWLGEIRVRRKDGASLTLQAAVHLVRNDRDEPLCVMFSCLDMTGKKEMEDRLHRSQRLETMGIFAAGIAHDFGNILGSMCCNLDLMRLRTPAGSPVEAQLEAVSASCEIAKGLLRRLTVFARGESLPRTRIDVADLLRRCAGLSLAGSGITFEAQVEGDPWIEGDESQLMQLFANLLINARQAMPSGGRILGAVSTRKIAAGEVQQLPEGRYVQVEITDEGTGIPEDTLAKVFDPFFTTKLEGVGLGLAICFSVARSHGGHIALASEPGAGTRATVLLRAE